HRTKTLRRSGDDRHFFENSSRRADPARNPRRGFSRSVGFADSNDAAEKTDRSPGLGARATSCDRRIAGSKWNSMLVPRRGRIRKRLVPQFAEEARWAEPATTRRFDARR